MSKDIQGHIIKIHKWFHLSLTCTVVMGWTVHFIEVYCIISELHGTSFCAFNVCKLESTEVLYT